VCGLPVALSVMLTEAVRAPVAEGVKVTFIVQLAPAASELPQVVVCAKSLAYGTRRRQARNGQDLRCPRCAGSTVRAALVVPRA